MPSSNEKTPRWAQCIVKLHNDDNEHVSSIPVSRLMAATESDRVSYSNLIRFTKLSLKFADHTSPAPAKHFNVQLHYRDEDGDDVLFTSDVELMEALGWAASSARGSSAPILVVHATVVPLSRRPSNASTTTSVSIGCTRSLMVQQHRSAESNSSTQPATKPSRVAPSSTSAACTSTTPQSSLDIEMPSLVASKEEKGSSKRRSNPLAAFLRKLLAPLPPLIKGEVGPEASSHVSVGEVLVGGLANVLGSAAVFIETQENSTQGRLASLGSERAIKAGVEHLTPLHRTDCTGKGFKHIVVSPPSLNTAYMPDFVHKRHSCDGCHMDPIVGFRYHAIPNIDLCERCFDTALVLSNSGNGKVDAAEEEEDRKPPSEIEVKADGEGSDGIGIIHGDGTITFEMVQHKSDQGVIHSKFANVLLRMRRGLKDLKKSQKEQLAVETRPEYAHTALEDSSRVSDFDVACAIQKSLQDLRKKQQVEFTRSCKNGEDDTTHVTEDSAGDKTIIVHVHTNSDENAKSQSSDDEW